jgi:cysteinyl-tRNA synthetase
VAARLAASVQAMLDVLGVDPYAAPWAGSDGSDDDALRGAIDHLVAGLLAARAEARAAKDWARADAIRDQLKSAGIVVDDTSGGSRWSLAGKDD